MLPATILTNVPSIGDTKCKVLFYGKLYFLAFSMHEIFYVIVLRNLQDKWKIQQSLDIP